jgi:spore coat protein U-like protein
LFGAMPAFTTGVTQTGAVTFTCNKGATVKLTISNGSNFGLGQSATLRAMKSGSDYVSYHIYTPTGATFSSCAAASTDWPASPGLDVSSLWTSTGGPKTTNLCGAVDAAPAGGYAVGSYSDLVTVTATF